jgi:hypothetical protein
MVDATRAERPGAEALERGTFHDDYRTYHVRASSFEAPDSFQVYTGPRKDIVLIISGINTGDLRATWGPFWRGFKPDWKMWVEDSAFRLFYRTRRDPGPDSASMRFCDG